MAYVLNSLSIGSAGGRDFPDMTTWEAALPTSVTTGDGRTEVGVMHPDSVFDESGVIIAGITTNLTAGVILRAVAGSEYNGNAGDGVIVKPSSGTLTFLELNIAHVMVYGIEFDGSGGHTGSGTGMVRLRGGGVACVRCCGHDHQHATIAAFLLTTNHDSRCLACIAHDNVGDGFNSNISRRFHLGFCGAANNGRNGIANIGAGNCRPLGGWSYGHSGGADYVNVLDSPLTGGFNFASDTSLPTAAQFSNQNSKLIGDANFANAGAGDFRLAAGSSHLLAGPPSLLANLVGTISNQYGFTAIDKDIADTPFSSTPVGSRYDVGPQQFSHAPVVPDASFELPLELETDAQGIELILEVV